MIDVNFGINHQAMAVMQYMRMFSGIESSWSKENKAYMADVEVAPWYNGRERGVVFSLKDRSYRRQLNIAVFEHRNSDQICAVMFEAYTFNPPTLADVPAGVYESKGDVSKSFGFGRAADMAQWVYDQLEAFWVEANATAEDVVVDDGSVQAMEDEFPMMIFVPGR